MDDKEYKNLLNNLKKVDAPPDFLAKVHERLEKRSKLREMKFQHL